MSETATGRLVHAPVPFAGEAITDFRARIIHHQAEAAERRHQDLAEQASTLNTPEARIRIWERVHEIGLPRDPAHRLIDVIAANTGLTLEQVRDEQRQRTMPAIPKVGTHEAGILPS